MHPAASVQGIALVKAQHAEEDLASGRLVVALNRPWPSRLPYNLVTRNRESRTIASADVFRVGLSYQACMVGSLMRLGC